MEAVLRAVRPAERAGFTRTVMAVLGEGDLRMEAVMQRPFVRWWAYRVLHYIFHSRSRPFYLEVDGVQAGFLVLQRHKDALRVEALGTLPPFRRMGLGRFLLAQAEEEARRLGLRRLELQVSTGNSPALSLYLDERFWPVPRRWSAIWLERPLDQGGS